MEKYYALKKAYQDLKTLAYNTTKEQETWDTTDTIFATALKKSMSAKVKGSIIWK